MKLVKILLALAVFAAAGMMAAGCDSLAGSGDDGEAVFAEAGALALNSAGEGQSNDTIAKKTIKVKFEVLNGGAGLWLNAGIVSTQDDSYLVFNKNSASKDFTITIAVPASDEYLNVRWWGNNFWLFSDTYLKAKMKPESGTITVDYNGRGKAATKNLYDVSVTTKSGDWRDALERAVNN